MDIPQHDSQHLTLDSSRRLTGPSLVWGHSGAIIDVLVSKEITIDRLLECWYSQIKRLLPEVGWQGYPLAHRVFENGVSLLIAAPVDQLYSATEVLELAWYYCSSELLDLPEESVSELIEELREAINAEANPRLVELEQAAIANSVDFLGDDELVSVGHGQSCKSWPLNQIPSSSEIDWSNIADIPIALVTGTNGKSTSVRVLDHIAKAAGQVSGVTSTDFVRVGDDVLDRGDYSGPGGARLLLRDKRLQVAFLEVARGGILRRGLPLRRARAALVTNVGQDHLGQYGINTLEALTEAKFVVAKALNEDAVLVTNADDAGIVKYLNSRPQPAPLCWFSLDKHQRQIQHQLNTGQRCCFTEDGQIFYFDGRELSVICAVVDIPMTMEGAARHNISNALGAVGVASAMGFSAQQIKNGLTAFHSDKRDNPGRLNRFKLKNGASLFVDFAHNAHSVSAVVEAVKQLPARQKWALFSSAGDRSNDEVRAIASGVCAMKPDHVVIAEIEHYLRGRELGEVSELMKQACLDCGLQSQQIHLVESPLIGVKLAASRLQQNDLGLMLVLSERDAVIDFVNSLE